MNLYHVTITTYLGGENTTTDTLDLQASMKPTKEELRRKLGLKPNQVATARKKKVVPPKRGLLAHERAAARALQRVGLTGTEKTNRKEHGFVAWLRLAADAGELATEKQIKFMWMMVWKYRGQGLAPAMVSEAERYLKRNDVNR